MDKLKFFTFNNLRWQYRKFRWDEIKDSCGALCLAGTGYVWLEPFAILNKISIGQRLRYTEAD